MEKESREIEIDLIQLVRTMREKIIYVVIVTVVLGIAGFLYSKMCITPIYQASAKMIVNTQTGDTTNVSSDRLNSARDLVDTYAVIIRDLDVMNRVISELDLSESYGKLASCVTVKAVNNTQIMQIVVQHTNRETALAVAEKIQQIAPDIIVETVGVGSIKPIGQARVGATPISPNHFKKAILAALVGFALSCGTIIVMCLMDNTYKSDIDIQGDLDLIVLGVIPKVECCKKNTKYGYGYDPSAKMKTKERELHEKGKQP